MDNTQSTLYTDSGIILQNSDSVLPTNLVVSDASGKRTSVTIEGDLYVAGEIKAGETNSDFDSDNSRLPSQDGNAGKFLETNGTSVFWDTVNQVPGVTAGVSGYLLTNNGSSASWTNGPIQLGTTVANTPMLSFGSSTTGFAEGQSAGGELPGYQQ